MGNAYRIPTARDRLRKQQQQIRDLQANLRNRDTPRPIATTTTAGSSAAGSTGGTGNFLSTEGGTMIGPLALKPPVDFTVDIDSSNTIDISPANTSQQYSSNIQIDDIPTSSTLDIIKGAAFDGQILIIRTFAPPIITISQGTLSNGGNIQTPDGTDVTIGDLQIVILVYDDSLIIEANTGGTWRLLNTFGTGGVSTNFSTATLALTSTQTAGVVDFDSNTILGTGISDQGNGIFLLSESVFQLNSSVLILGTDDSMQAKWQTSTDLAFTTPVDVGRISLSITLNSTTDDNLSNAPITTAFVDATSSNVFVRLLTTDSIGTGTIQTLGTWGQIFSIGSGGNGGSPLTTKGDLFGFDSANARIPVGGNGQVLTADSVESLGVKWATPAAGGMNTDLSNMISPTLPTVDLSMNGQSINNILSLDVEDSAGATKLGISGPLGIGARFLFISGDDVFFTENITDRLKINADGLDVFAGDIIQIDRLQMSGGTTSATSVNDVVWYLNSAGDLVSNVNATDGWIWSSGNIAKMILTDSTLEKRNVTAPSFQLYNTIAAQNGTAGTISFLANSANTSTGVSMGFIIGDTKDFTGDGRGALKFGVNLDGTPTQFLTMNEGDNEQVDILQETDFNSQDVLAVNRLQMSGGTTSATSVNDVVWYLNSAGDLVSNVNATDGWIWSSGNIAKMILTDSTLEKRNVTAPSFQLYNTRTAAIGTAGTINFLANSTGISTGVSMGFLISDTEAIAGNGRGSLKLGVNLDGTPTLFLTMNEGNDEQVDILKTLDMNTNPILSMGGETINSITTDGSPDGATDFVMTYDASATALKKVLLNNLPSGVSGANTSLSNLITTSINQDLLPNAAGVFNLGSTGLRWGNCFFGRIVFPTNTSPIAADVNIVRNNDDMQYNVGTGNTFNWTFQSGSTQMELSSTELRLPGVNLDMENNNITDAFQLQLTGSSGNTVRGLFTASSGVLDISEDENNGVIRMFAKNNAGTSNNMINIDGGTGLVEFGQGGIGFGNSANQPTIIRSSNDLQINTIAASSIILQSGATNRVNLTGTDLNILTGTFVDWQESVSSATSGSSTLPSNPAGFIKVKISGTERRIPFYQV